MSLKYSGSGTFKNGRATGNKMHTIHVGGEDRGPNITSGTVLMERRFSGTAGVRRASLPIATFAQDSAYFTEKALQQEAEPELAPAVSFFRLFRYATVCDFVLLFIGFIMACLNGLFVPLGVILYGEFTSLLIDRTQTDSDKESNRCYLLQYFGGCQVLKGATAEENKMALYDDSMAFGVGCAGMALVQFVVGVISVDLFNYSALKQIAKLKELFLRSVLRQDIQWYDLNTSVNFATKVSDDLEKFREGINEKIPMFVYLVMSFVTAVMISLFYGWALTLVILSCTPVIIGSTAIVAKVQSSLTTQELKAYSVAGVMADEVLSAIRTVVAFGGEQKEIDRYSTKLAPAKKMGYKKGLYAGIGSAIMWFIIYATYALAFWYGVGRILESRHETVPSYTAAVLMIVFFSVLQGAQNVGMTAPHLESLAMARAAAGSIYAVIDRVPTIDCMSTEGSKPSIDGDLELKDVHFRYPARADVKVLDGLSLKIPRNATVALVGSSGCGKSTCLQLLQRMYDPESGSVKASNHDLKRINVKHYRDHLAVVGQEPVLFAGTIKENIRMSSPTCTDAEIIKAARQAYCHEFIKKLPNGYDTLIGERGAQLSGGQKQRIAIARALVRKPKILLLDEATSALDSHSEAKVQKALDAASQGRTTVMVSHRLATVYNADAIVYIEKGKVVESGTHDELMKLQGKYYELVRHNEPTTEEKPVLEGESKRESGAGTPTRRKLERTLSEQSTQSIQSMEVVLVEPKPTVERKPSTWQILKLCAPEKWLMLVGVFAAICVGASFPMFAVLFGETYGLLESLDEAFIRMNTNYIALGFIIVGLWTGLWIFVQIYIFNLTGVRLTARLRVAAYTAMLKQEIGWFDMPTNGVGALCSRLAADAAAVQGATGTRIGGIMQALATIGIGITLSLYYTWKLTLISLISVPLIMAGVILEGRVLEAGAAKIRKEANRANTIATEAISNIRTINAFCGEEGVVARYKQAMSSAQKAARKSLRWRGVVFSFGQTAPVAGYALSLYYGGHLVADKDLPYKDVIKVSEALIFGAWMMGQALAFAPNFSAAVLAAGRIFELMERQPTVASTNTPAVSADYVADGDITYSNIKFHYPTRQEVEVLQGLSVSIKGGQRVALVGPSGCGKSTLIQLLQRLYDPDDGDVYLDQHHIEHEMTLPTLRRNLGIVSQEPVLFDRSIAQNIAYGDNTREVKMEEIVHAAKEANVHGFIAALPSGYETKVGARASQLSGGQKQRIAIARALIRNPRVLLLDEATSALDTHSEKIVQAALDRASVGRTCLIIAHRLATIQNADVIHVIDRGVIQESGKHEELLKNKGLYAKLYELQCGIVDEAEENNNEADQTTPTTPSS